MHESALLLIAAYAYSTRALALFDQQIPRTPPPALQPAQHPARQQVVDVPQRCVRRAFAHRRPPGIRQLAVHAVDVAVCRSQSANIHPQPAGDARAHAVQVECLAFNGAVVVMTSCVSVCNVAWSRCARPSPAMRPAKCPCARWTCASGAARAAASNRHFGQSGRCQM